MKKLDMHALRHTFASLLLSQGAPITEVSSYLGHADPQITLKVYSHWIPRTKTDSISRLPGMILNAKKPTAGQDGHFWDTSKKVEQFKKVELEETAVNA